MDSSHNTERDGAANNVESAPLVSFILFAYNQENTVRAAIEGAFSQTYSPLEILLSDDGSQDNTFAIMQEMAQAYDGPHQVRLHRPAQNLGSINHVITAAHLAAGEYIICSAGDDISYPDRASKVVECFLQTNAVCVNSFYDTMDAEGKPLSKDNRFPVVPSPAGAFKDSRIARRYEGHIRGVFGCVASYRRDFWTGLPLSPKKLLLEDSLAGMLINSSGGVMGVVPHSLVCYRIHDQSQSLHQVSSLRIEAIIARERKMAHYAQQKIDVIDFFFDIACAQNIPVEACVRKALEQTQAYSRVVAQFWDTPPLKRFRFLLRARRKDTWLYLLTRLWGERVFITLKTLAMKGK
jgi:glycosyltransferase involved in cell wall biosynthesis